MIAANNSAPTNSWKKSGMCMLKGAAVGAGGALVVGGMAVGAVAPGGTGSGCNGGSTCDRCLKWR
jgi:hypothetical protein